MTSYYNNNNNNNRQSLTKRNNTNNTDGDTSSYSRIIARGGNTTHGTDDLTAGDESSILLRGGGGGGRPTLTNNTNANNVAHLGIQKKNSEASGYNFGNSSVGGSSSVIRHDISYNPTVNTNHMTFSTNSMVGRGVGGAAGAAAGSGAGNTTSDYMTMLHWQNFCGLCSVYDLKSETLEYNYVTEAAANAKVSAADPSERRQSQPYPRIRSRGEYYIDTYNDEPYSWTMGTHEQNGTWCNSSDQAGTIMSAMVWVLMLYSAFTVTALTITEGIPVTLGMVYAFFVFMSLASHAKTSFTDPGSVPVQAIPSERQRLLRDSHSMCGQCQTFKPPGSHHCRICNRCISRMDHHCPWMNNCVGAGNLKHFCLFLIYTWLCASYSLIVFGWNYFFCSDEDCTFHPLVLHLVRLMTLLAVGAFLFTSSMLMNVCYGIMTGIGTIDRLKKKATNTMSQSDEEPIQLIDVFGIGGFWTWPFPIDPIFDEHDRVMGYTLPSRLDRERQFCELVAQQQQQSNTTTITTNNIGTGGSIKANNSMDYPGKCVNDLLPV